MPSPIYELPTVSAISCHLNVKITGAMQVTRFTMLFSPTLNLKVIAVWAPILGAVGRDHTGENNTRENLRHRKGHEALEIQFTTVSIL